MRLMTRSHTVIYIPSSIPSPELEILLAKAQQCIDEQKKVTLISCNGGSKIRCPLNIWGSDLICMACKGKRQDSFAKLNGEFSVVFTPETLAQHEEISAEIRHIQTKEEFKSFANEGQDIGQSAYSSYISVTRDQNLQSLGAAKTTQDLLRNALTLYVWFKDILQEMSVDHVILYNGRQNNSRPLLRAAQKSGVRATVMEFSGIESDCVYEYENALPQDIDYLYDFIQQVWKRCDKDKKRLAVDYFQFKRDGGVINDHKSYVLGQSAGELPVNFDHNKKNIAVFNSSEDEFAALGGVYDKTIYANQYSALEKICQSLKSHADIVIWLRMHPNLHGVKWDFAIGLETLSRRFANIEIIPASSSVSTYALLDACQVAVTFGSTMTMEACYAGKPSILLGRCIYEKFSGIYVPQTHEEVIDLLTAANLPALDSADIQKIAIFWKDGGQTIDYFTGSRITGFLYNEYRLNFTTLQRAFYSAGKFLEKISLKFRMNATRFFAKRRL